MDAPADELSRRIEQTRAQIEQLNQEMVRLFAQQEREAKAKEASERAQQQAAEAAAPQNAAEALENAVLRYAVACGAVDVQIALLRAQGTFGGKTASGVEGTPSGAKSDILQNLADSLEEQSEASAVLRGLARTIRQKRG